ncbi:MAG: radical SAM protein, partial [Candidatus Zixiibacteriota bacterium]
TARQIRRKKEGKLITVFGGPMFQLYNLDALLRHFAEIDHIAIGEGEEALDEIARDFESGTRAPQVIARLAAPFSKDPVGRNHNAMDRYPPPDYDDIGKPKIKEQSIATYIGKGCHHSRCSFCAITERGLHVRPPATIFNEIQHLISRYGTTNINFGDWEINGDPKVLEELCDLLIKNKIRLQAWGELSARNVSPALLRKMKQAGISDVQIGIESFSSRLLRLMRKPAGLLDNVKVLKWGIEAEMHTMFSNIVCNHPLSHADFVEENYRVMRMIAHLLRPPVELNLNELDLYRTSELFRKADEYGISNIRDYRFYQRCYPEGSIGGRIPMFNLSFRKFPIHPLWKRIDRFLLRIRKHPVRLSIRNLKDGAKIYDSRGFNGRSYRLGGLDSHVLRQTLDQVAKPQDAAVALEVSEEVVLASLRRLVRARLVLQRGNLYLGLPLRK